MREGGRARHARVHSCELFLTSSTPAVCFILIASTALQPCETPCGREKQIASTHTREAAEEAHESCRAERHAIEPPRAARVS